MNADDWEDLLFDRLVRTGQAFAWVTVLALFLVGAFSQLPQLTGHTLRDRARRCFQGARWLLVLTLFVHLVRLLLVNLEEFNQMVGGARGGDGSSVWLMAAAFLFLPTIEGMLFLLAVVLFVAGLPGMVEPGSPPGPEIPRQG